MQNNVDIKQDFESVQNNRSKDMYNAFKLEILASQIKQKKRVKFSSKNNLIYNYLY